MSTEIPIKFAFVYAQKLWLYIITNNDLNFKN